MNREKDGSIELLHEDHLQMPNPLGHPVVGWLPTSEGFGGLYNPRGYAGLRAVVKKMIDGTMRCLYDQIILVENAGSIIIAQLGDRVGLVQNFRMVGERLLSEAGAEYIRRLDQGKLWSQLLESLGAWQWECPRGLVPPGAHTGDARNESLEEFVLRSAKLEALEEAGFTIANARIVGRVNMNPTFFPHAQYVVHADIESMDEARPEDLEIIGDKRLFTMAELRALNDAGEFDDGLTLAALALCGMHL